MRRRCRSGGDGGARLEAGSGRRSILRRSFGRSCRSRGNTTAQRGELLSGHFLASLYARSQFVRQKPFILQETASRINVRGIDKTFPTVSVEECFKAFIPLQFCCERWHCSELIIKYDMKLRRDVVGARIEHERDCSRVLWRKTDKNALPSTTVPLRDLLTVLQRGIQNVDGAAEDVAPTQRRLVILYAGEDLLWRQTAQSQWHLVVNPSGIRHCQRPQIDEGEQANGAVHESYLHEPCWIRS